MLSSRRIGTWLARRFFLPSPFSSIALRSTLCTTRTSLRRKSCSTAFISFPCAVASSSTIAFTSTIASLASCRWPTAAHTRTITSTNASFFAACRYTPAITRTTTVNSLSATTVNSLSATTVNSLSATAGTAGSAGSADNVRLTAITAFSPVAPTSAAPSGVGSSSSTSAYFSSAAAIRGAVSADSG